jgi:protein-S-isoprenylcysteine O-methyltransferase Ste14
MNLALRAAKSAVVGLIVLGVIVFLPAGTLAYWQGWAFIVVFTVSTNLIGLYLARNDPALLERRMKVGPAAETRPLQKAIIAIAFAGAIALVIISALDHRVGWSHAPAWIAVLGNVLVALGLMIDLVVFRANSYGASTIEKMAGQHVITTGPYALVRHPMYVGVLILVIGTPLALGSYWGLLFLLLNVPILVLRILDEERMLASDLDGYTTYMRTVRYRLVPGLW